MKREGKVKFFNQTKGYGFIQPTDGAGKDVFVHISDLQKSGIKTLAEGQGITFDLTEDRGKVKATNIEVA